MTMVMKNIKNANNTIMPTPKKTGGTMGTAMKAGIGATLTAAAVAAAGAYFLYGSKNAKANRKKVATWVEDAKKEVIKGLQKAKTMSEEEYKELVEKVSAAHSSLSKISKSELAAFKKDMQQGWKVIAKNAASAAVAVGGALPTKSASATKKVVAKSVDKTSAKAAKPSLKKAVATKTPKTPVRKVAK